MVGQTGTKDRAPSSARAENDAEGGCRLLCFTTCLPSTTSLNPRAIPAYTIHLPHFRVCASPVECLTFTPFTLTEWTLPISRPSMISAFSS